MMATSAGSLDVAAVSGGLLIVRLALGLPMAAHGTQKLFGWFGGYGVAGTAGFFEQLGFRPGKPFVVAASLSELTGGLLLALGFLGPIGAALVIAPMVVAMLTVHRGNYFFASGNGIEVPYLYSAGAVALAFTGFGAASLDALLGLAGLASPALAAATLAAGVLGGLGTLVLRQPVAKSAEARG